MSHIPEFTATIGEATVEACMEQIRNQGVAGLVIVVDQERVHFRTVLDAPWTAISMNEETGGVRVRMKTADFRTRAQAKKTAELTAHVVMQLRDVSSMFAAQMQRLADTLAEQWQIDHTSQADFQPPTRRK